MALDGSSEVSGGEKKVRVSFVCIVGTILTGQRLRIDSASEQTPSFLRAGFLVFPSCPHDSSTPIARREQDGRRLKYLTPALHRFFIFKETSSRAAAHPVLVSALSGICRSCLIELAYSKRLRIIGALVKSPLLMISNQNYLHTESRQ